MQVRAGFWLACALVLGPALAGAEVAPAGAEFSFKRVKVGEGLPGCGPG